MALYQHDFAICPWCGEQSGGRVDHLYGDALPASFGPWYCKECRKPFRGKVNAPGDVTIERAEGHKDRFSRSMALLKFDGKDGPVFFVMDHNRYWPSDEEGTDEQNQGHQRYFFEEHSCPTNWLRECVAVIENGDCDPHGFLQFVRAVDVPDDFDEDAGANWQTLFPEVFGPTLDLDANRPPRMIE